MLTGADTAHRTRAVAEAFGQGAFGEAVDQFTADGSDRVVASFPAEFGEQDDAEGALEGYWRGLYAQYGDFEAVGDVTLVDDDSGGDATDGAMGMTTRLATTAPRSDSTSPGAGRPSPSISTTGGGEPHALADLRGARLRRP